MFIDLLTQIHFKYILHFFLHKTLYYLLVDTTQIYITYKILYYNDNVYCEYWYEVISPVSPSLL